MQPRFSIAIPNFNYGHFLGRTIQSVLDQGDMTVEIVVSDNASTDNSVEVARSFGSDVVTVIPNLVNVGFAANLDRAVTPTTGTHVILLSSDDVMLPGALATYRQILETSENPNELVLSSRYLTIDGGGRTLAEPEWPQWVADLPNGGKPREPKVPEVRAVDASALLRASLLGLRNPLAFATVCYPRVMWEKVGGYGAARHFNPDKWFTWRLLAENPQVALVDDALFGYRVHDGGQTQAMRKSGALKYLVDQYAYTYETSDKLLAFAGVKRDELCRAFVRHDGSARALALMAKGERREAGQYSLFVRATYPELAHRDPWWWAARIGSMTPLGVLAARQALRALQRLR